MRARCQPHVLGPCSRLNCVPPKPPPKRTHKPQPLVPANVTLFRNTVLAGVIKVTELIQVGPNPTGLCLTKGGHEDPGAHREQPLEDKPKTAKECQQQPQKPGRGRLQRERSPADTLTLDFWPPEL